VKIQLITTCGATTTPLPLAAHAVRFWINHGVDHIAILLQRPTENDHPATAPFRRVFETDRIEVHDWVGEFTTSTKHRLMQSIVSERLRPSPDDWMIVADMDEFPDFNGIRASEFFRSLPQHICCVHGDLLDRVAPGGMLAEMTDRNLADQYPFVAHIKFGFIHKVIATRRGVEWVPGHHVAAFKGKLYQVGQAPWSYTQSLWVHHFKWDASVVSRMWRRAKTFRRHKNEISHWREPIHAWISLKKHGWRITEDLKPDTSNIREFLK